MDLFRSELPDQQHSRTLENALKISILFVVVGVEPNVRVHVNEGLSLRARSFVLETERPSIVIGIRELIRLPHAFN